MTGDKVSTLLLFGATGDLSHRMLLPSLYGLHADGLLPENLKIVATARSALDDQSYRASVMEALAAHVPADFYDPAIGKAFAERMTYVALDATQERSVDRRGDRSGRPRRAASSRARRPCPRSMGGSPGSS